MPTTTYPIGADGDKITIRTNHHYRELVAWWELEEADRADFDYVEEADQFSPRFVNYRGSWIDTADMDGTTANLHQLDPLKTYHQYQADSFFSGIAIRYVTEETADNIGLEPWEWVQIATYWV